MKNVLMIAYHYPPEGSSSGVLRTLKFSKYLLQFGWRPYVLTVHENFYRVKDPELTRDIPPEIAVVRTPAFNTHRYWDIPDRFIGWVPFGLIAGKKIIRRKKVGALFSTSPVPSAHIIAYLLKRRFRLPWLADFRDPWIEEGIWPRPGTFRYRVESKLERAVLSSADRISVTTGGLRDELMQRFPQLQSDKVVTIENGFDEEDFRRIEGEDRGRSDSYLILHAGMVTPDYRDPFPFLEPFADLVRKKEIAKGSVRVCFLGGGDYVESEDFSHRLRRLGIRDFVEVRSRISYYEGLRLLFAADALLLLQDSDDTRHLIPAKAFEYLRARRPILGLMNEGATADLIRQTKGGLLLDPGNPALIKETLRTLLRCRNGTLPGFSPGNDGIFKFERRHLTERLAEILESLTRERQIGAPF
jgi:Glycosyl transferase 4-like domain